MDSLQLLALALGGALWLWFIFPRVVSLLLRYLFSCHVSLEQIGFFPLSVKRFSLANGWLEVSFDRLFVGKNNVEGDTYFRVEVKGLAVAIRPRTTPVEIASLESRCLDVGQLYENVLGKLYGVLGWASYSLDSWKITIGTEIREESAKLEFQVCLDYLSLVSELINFFSMTCLFSGRRDLYRSRPRHQHFLM